MSISRNFVAFLSLSVLAGCGKGPVLDPAGELPEVGTGDGSGGIVEGGSDEGSEGLEDSSTGVEHGGGGGSSGAAEGGSCGSTGGEESTGAVEDETGGGDPACAWDVLLGCICDDEPSPIEADAFGCWCGGSGAVEVPWEFCE
jgi:hypothetical protein